MLSQALQELDGETGRRRGAPNRTKIVHQARTSKRSVALARARRLDTRTVSAARTAVHATIMPAFRIAPPMVDPLDEVRLRAWGIILTGLAGRTSQLIVEHIAAGKDPVEAASRATLKRGLDSLNAATGNRFNAAQVEIAIEAISAALGDKGQRIMALPAVVLMLHELRRARGRPQGESEGESGWAAAQRRLAGGTAGASSRRPAAARAPRRTAAAPLAAPPPVEVLRAIARAAAPAFAAAIDRSVHPDLVVRVVKQRKTDVAKVRQAVVTAAVRHFAATFVQAARAAASGTPARRSGSSLVAAALTEALRHVPVAPGTAVPTMAAAVKQALAPKIAALAQAACGKAAPAGRTRARRAPAPSRGRAR